MEFFRSEGFRRSLNTCFSVWNFSVLCFSSSAASFHMFCVFTSWCAVYSLVRFFNASYSVFLQWFLLEWSFENNLSDVTFSQLHNWLEKFLAIHSTNKIHSESQWNDDVIGKNSFSAPRSTLPWAIFIGFSAVYVAMSTSHCHRFNCGFWLPCGSPRSFS